ncbi:carboxy-S-adenosyl-L-methionine synthase CmoA [Candidatus Pantoea carbekii]|uniref:carboxy-S-adenosyl-L-methionine synthase CmoA n=1 Tax=Candidatus Pantoea carbekii TaxID=1235990 RepID=UPI0006187D51|nr:carboxy-S-adenosyl-L-methionine synthase CmoA [Candidatus Pantoea carbekii]AKC32040.1 protein YecO [Candidatus Pantoea carbekii]
MSKRDMLFSIPMKNIEDWTFDEHVAKVFPDMIQRSIPGYSNIISMIGMLAKRVVQPNSKVYDLGCALGAAALSVHRNINVQGCQIIAVDKSKAMVERCRRNVSHASVLHYIEVIEADICDILIENASLVVLNFTLQFVNINARLTLLKKIFQGLNPRGILILSEKFSFQDINIESVLSDMHHDFKRANGYSELQINQKCHMLENIMFIDTLETHKERLKQAGFSHTELWFQYFNFGSLISLK